MDEAQWNGRNRRRSPAAGDGGKDGGDEHRAIWTDSSRRDGEDDAAVLPVVVAWRGTVGSDGAMRRSPSPREEKGEGKEAGGARREMV